MTPKSLIEPARHAGTALLRSQSDARLVDLTRDGNERAFEAIVHRYHRALLRYCSRLLPAARAEDAVQQAFLSAHRAIHAGDAELNLRPWLYKIAHNSALNLLRQNGFDHDQVSEEIDGVETPPQAFERGERLRTVVAAVQELPDRQRDAIVLQAVEGRSYDEIAAELGVTDGAVRQLLNRARTTLREAAAALTPTGFLTRIAANGGEAPLAERIAAAVTGAGGGALLAKAGATIVVAGAVASGAATGALPGTGERAASADSAEAAAASDGRQQSLGGGSGASVVLTGGVRGGKHTAGGILTGRHGGGGPTSTGQRGTSGPRGGAIGGPGSRDDSGHQSGPGSSDGEDHSGSGSSGSGGGDDHSGSGSSGSDDHSGSGSSGSSGGDDHSGSGSSGSGSSGSSGSGSSGSGTSGSGSSGSGSSGSGSSGSGTSGSGTSGSGKADDPPALPEHHSGSGKGE